jgi:lysozyme
MKLDLNGYNLIKTFEGLSLKPYLCSAKVPTIGYGNTFYTNGIKVKMSDAPITQEKANEMLKVIADSFALKVSKIVPNNLTQNQFNALVSFAFNLGVQALSNSTLLRLVKINPNDANIAKQFLRWNIAGGEVVDGLTKRRIKESALYFSKV